MGTYKLAEVMEKPCSDLLALTPKEVCECDGTGIMEILLITWQQEMKSLLVGKFVQPLQSVKLS